MDNQAFAEEFKVIKGISAAADFIAGGVASDVILARDFKKVVFIAQFVGGTTGKGTMTVQATAANTTSSPTAIPFKYSRVANGAVEGQGALTAATEAGVQSTPAENQIFIIEVDPRDLPDAKPYVHLAISEDVNDPVTGFVLALLGEPRYKPTFPNVLS